MILRLTLDVNVWVNNYLSLAMGREDSAAQQLVRSAFLGHCRLGPVQPIISHAMLETLQEVLARSGLPEVYAVAARNAVEAAATGGIAPEPPHLVLASGVQPVKDTEDRSVLETAIAGAADLLVTNNFDDFTPGPRADIDAEIIRRGLAGRADILLFRRSRLEHGFVIASVFAARAWLNDGMAPPKDILGRFFPQEETPRKTP
jgi:predicted nucleic acid-binding protein